MALKKVVMTPSALLMLSLLFVSSADGERSRS